MHFLYYPLNFYTFLQASHHRPVTHLNSYEEVVVGMTNPFRHGQNIEFEEGIWKEGKRKLILLALILILQCSSPILQTSLSSFPVLRL